MYGITAAPGKAPDAHMVSVIAGLTCPPDALPAGLRISPKRSTPTAAPMMSSRTLTVGIAEEIGEGPTTQRTNVVAPNSRTSTKRNSSRLCQRITAVVLRDGLYRAACIRRDTRLGGGMVENMKCLRSSEMFRSAHLPGQGPGGGRTGSQERV